MSAEKFQRLGKRVSVIIYFGGRYVYDPESKELWKVQIEFKENGTEIKFEEINENLETALTIAYTRLDQTVTTGLGASAMMPAIEYQASTKPNHDDDIPF